MVANVVLTVLGLGSGAVGVVLLIFGGRRLRTVYHVLRNDPVPIYQLESREGVVEVAGTARADEDARTISAPLTGSVCLAFSFEAQEYRQSGQHGSWHTLDEGQGGVPFFVERDGDYVRVDPAGADLHLEEHTIDVDPGDEPPGTIARYIEATEDVELQDGTLDLKLVELNVGNRQRFVERRLDVGEDAYVYGTLRRSQRAAEWGSGVVDVELWAGEDSPAFVVSDTSERGTAWRIARGAIGWTIGGLLVTALGAGMLLFGISI